MVAPFHFDRTWSFGVSPAELWDTLQRTDRYQEWWPWLRTFDVAGGLLTTGTARCAIRGPLPYSLAFTVRVSRLVPAVALEAVVDGDIAGPARLEITPTDAGCRARLAWDVELRDQILLPLARIARPALEWGHERVVSSGVEQFRRRALREAAAATQEL